MTLDFDLKSVKVTEFGVGRDEANGQSFVAVPVDGEVQAALQEMVQATWNAMDGQEDGPSVYEPSEKHSAVEYLTLPLVNDMASSVRILHEAANLSIASNALDDPSNVFCYFARLSDKKGRRLSALRRATQFKGVLKKRLIRFVTDSMKLIDDRVFKLDSDFDLLVDSASVHILRPSGFEFAGNLQYAIVEAVPENIKAIAKEIAFVDFSGIEAYAGKHPRAARYLASIRGQDDTKNIDKSLLKKLCKDIGVPVADVKGRITVTTGHEMDFLEVLDRRRYEVNLVKGRPERYRAASRKRLSE